MVLFGALIGSALVAGAVWFMLGDDDAPEERDPEVARSIVAQRERVYVTAVQSSLRNGAVAMETYGVTQPDYSGATLNALIGVGLRVPAGITMSASTALGSYCITATHESLPDDHPWKTATFDRDAGTTGAGDTCG